MQKYQHIEEILPLFRCVECGAPVLQIVSNDKRKWSEYAFGTGEIALCCNQCSIRYPVTDDGIPILWTSQLKEMLRKKTDSSYYLHDLGGGGSQRCIQTSAVMNVFLTTMPLTGGGM